jgi:hypothetical protein
MATERDRIFLNAFGNLKVSQNPNQTLQGGSLDLRLFIKDQIAEYGESLCKIPYQDGIISSVGTGVFISFPLFNSEGQIVQGILTCNHVLKQERLSDDAEVRFF